MKVAFNSSLDDTTALYEALVLHQRANGHAAKPFKQNIMIFGSLVLTIAILWVTSGTPPYLLMAILILLIFLMLFRQKAILRRRLRKHFAMTIAEGQWVPNIMELNAAGITNITRDNVTAFWWPQISTIAREAEYLRIYTHLSSVTQVPLRVFRTPEEIDRFENEARRLWDAHKNDPPVSFPEISGIIQDEVSAPGCILINPNQPDSATNTQPES